MKFIKNNIKLIIGVIVGIILVSGLSVYAAYSYLASDISYTQTDGTKLSVQDALSELYNKKSTNVYEIGELNQYVSAYSNYVTVTINLKKTYSETDNAKLAITSITTPNAMYFSSAAIANKIIGNTVNITLLNYAGNSSYSKNYNVKYAIYRFDS